MNEETKSGFKVSDKRKFNIDGTVRDSYQEPPPAVQPPPAAQPQPDARATQESEGAADPATFANFIYGLGLQAFSHLGVSNPMIGEATIDLKVAKHYIDLLGVLQQKTRGNLTGDEERLLNNLLRDLRMQFVSLTKSKR